MTSTAPARPAVELDAAYRARRISITHLVAAAAARTLTFAGSDRGAAVSSVIPVVESGQRTVAALVDAYMAAKALETVGHGRVIGLDPARYTISALRSGVAAERVYSRVFLAYDAVHQHDPPQALTAAHAALGKLVRTDLQLAQTHAARDWMTTQTGTATDITRIVGYRRVLTGPGPHCALCTAASTRTYRVEDLMPIHEHCGCTVEPLWGDHAVASIGTTVRVEEDPELGPRLMADSWSPVGPRLT